MNNDWPPEQQLREVIRGLVGSPPFITDWQGTTYRFVSRNYADRDRFTNGEGARRSGGRFTPIGAQRTVYLSLDRATATAELDSWYDYYSVPDTAFQPRVLAAVGVSLEAVLDLSAIETLDRLGITPAHIAEEWRPISDEGGVAAVQLFGRLIYEAGCEGIRFPSVRRPDGINLALFPDNFREGSHTLLLNWD